MWVTEILSSFFCILFLCWLRERHRRMTFLQRYGIPGPQPNWLWGNLTEYLDTPNVVWDTLLSNKYGSVCGYYLGAKPVIIATDLSLLEKIQGSMASHYLDRPRRVPGGINPDPKRAQMLGNLKVPEWTQLRRILNKGFSPAKLQEMWVDARDLVGVFMNQLPLSIGTPHSRPLDFYSLYQNLTLDLIFKTGFGINSNAQENPDAALKRAVEQEFSKSTSTSILKAFLCFPELRWILLPIRVALEKLKQCLGMGPHTELWDLGYQTVEERVTLSDVHTRPPSDLLHLMVSSGLLSKTAIVANSVLFFEAGFETLSTSLAFITHLLMTHLEVQQNVRNEIRDQLQNSEGHLENLNMLSNFPYLSAVIKEALRMYPPQTTFIGRSGDQDLSHDLRSEDGTPQTIIIPKNTHVQVGLYQILNNARIWESPREFRPQRFMGELTREQNLAYQPFGKGRRICIGRKYAEMVLKMLFINLLSRFEIIPDKGRNQAVELDVVFKTATMAPKNGVWGCVVWDPLFPVQADTDMIFG